MMLLHFEYQLLCNLQYFKIEKNRSSFIIIQKLLLLLLLLCKLCNFNFRFYIYSVAFLSILETVTFSFSC